MQAIIKVHGNKSYLHITRSADTTFTAFKGSRSEMLRRFQSGLERLLSDCRAVDFECLSLLEADTLARDLKDDLPACVRVAVVTRSLGAPIFRHFQNVCLCYGIEARFFTEPVEASAWLCGDEEAPWDTWAGPAEAEDVGGDALGTRGRLDG